MIRLDEGDFGTFVVTDTETGEDILIQTDWDYPGIAMDFGWSPCHNETDGTIDCPVCGMLAGAMIEDARVYLNEHVGEVAEDPGYFNN